jgi:hypothetical protein
VVRVTDAILGTAAFSGGEQALFERGARAPQLLHCLTMPLVFFFPAAPQLFERAAAIGIRSSDAPLDSPGHWRIRTKMNAISPSVLPMPSPRVCYAARRTRMPGASSRKSLYLQVLTAIGAGALLGYFSPHTGAAMRPLGRTD